MDKNQQLQIQVALELAFMAGSWLGQVELEESMDRQYGTAALDAVYSRKMSMPRHEKANFQVETIEYTLRSQEWRDGVRKSTKEYFNKALEYALAGSQIELLGKFK